MATTKTARRYYLHKRLEARSQLDTALEVVWQSKQEAEPGVALDATFPHRATLVALGYTTNEDLDGADADELRCAGLSSAQANDVIAAL
ncbi:MAG: hypothetical protein GVY18_09085 [Bacteroidetes bacterium]|jgi:hypothetical protein|nr:hypothetical protein [Bacteroidota bacterium]